MSHFSVVVCLDDRDGSLARAVKVAAQGYPDAITGVPEEDANAGYSRRVVENKLTAVLARWDENKEAEPSRVYEEDGPEDWWFYQHLADAAEHEKNGTGVLPYKPDEIGWSSDSSRETEADQQLKIAKEAALFHALPEPVTWEALFDVYQIAYPGEDRDREVDEDGRGYRVTTYNPDSKWDYWRIGGRWGGSFPFDPDFASEVLTPERGWDSPDKLKLLSCDGGPKRALDLGKMRDDAAEEARETYRAYHALTGHLPEALPWQVFADNVSEGNGYTIEQAREEYHKQPRVQALRGTDFQWREDCIKEFGVSEDTYAEKARAGAVPGFAVVTTDGRWMAPGSMGWFAVTDATDGSRIQYLEAANAYIESLPDDAWLVTVDMHI